MMPQYELGRRVFGSEIPEAGGTIPASRYQPATFGANRHGADSVFVSIEDNRQASRIWGVQVP